MIMNIEAIIATFTKRNLNIKTNNYIFTNINNLEFLEKIPPKCKIMVNGYELDLGIEEALNIKIDLSRIKVNEILSYVFQCIGVNEKLEFKHKFDLLPFQGKLRDLNIIVQLLFYNLENLTKEEQMLLNEMYYFYSDYFNVSSFIKETHFQTHFLSENRVLDNRENYIPVSAQESLLKLTRNKKFR